MTYQPTPANRRFKLTMSIVCDVCGKIRGRANHRKCSEIRKAAGFTE